VSRYAAPPTLSGEFLIREVTVVDPVDGSAAAGMDVHVKGGKIVAVSHSRTESIESRSPVVDGRGRYLVPGFMDMHAHALNSPDDVDGAYALMLANGVVGFRQMSGSPALLAHRAAGTLPAPLGAPALLATAGDLLTPMNAATPEAAAATVRSQQAQGADFIKVGLVRRDAFLAALDAAGRLGIPLVGHLPEDVDPREAARGGMRCIEHLGPGVTMFASTSFSEAEVRAVTGDDAGVRIPQIKLPGVDRVVGRMIKAMVVNPAARTTEATARALAIADTTFDEDAADRLAALFAENSTWQCPTLIRVHAQQFPNTTRYTKDARRKYMAPDELRSWEKSNKKFAALPSATRDVLETHWAAQLRLTRVLAAAGVPMLAGTDADGAVGVIPGFALHDEFALLAEAGLDPADILRAATSDAARFLDVEHEAGRILQGFRADAVLLTDDPLAGSAALGAIHGVVRAGSFWDRSALDATLEAVAAAPGAH